MTKQELKFDDTVEDRDGTIWTQVCNLHSKQLETHKLETCPCNGLICGVEECIKEATHYYTITEGKQ